MSGRHQPVSEEWKYYSKKSGWTLVVKHITRTLLYLYPAGVFTVVFVFGDKAVKAEEDAGLPAEIMAPLKTAKRYVEGRLLEVDVRTKRDVRIVSELARLKGAN